METEESFEIVAKKSTGITSRRLETLSELPWEAETSDLSLPNKHPTYSNPFSDPFPPDDIRVITKKKRGRLKSPSYLGVFIFLRIKFVSILYLSLPMDQDVLSEFVFSAASIWSVATARYCNRSGSMCKLTLTHLSSGGSTH